MCAFFWQPVYETNSLDAFVPEIWAQEGLMILEEQMLIAGLVYRDFSNQIAQFGDTVNTRYPAEFTAQLKADADDVTVQNATATNVPVVLDQHLHVSFRIRDGEESKGFQNLRDQYLVGAMRALARGVDEILIGHRYDFINNNVGKLQTSPTRSTVIDAVAKADTLKWPLDGRNFLVSPTMKGAILNVDDFIQADKRGDGGQAMREALIGRVLGFNWYMGQNARYIATGSTKVTGAINNTEGYAIGDTTIAVDGFSAAITAGGWITVAGDMTPQLVISTVGGATPTSITIAPGLAHAVSDNAVVTSYTPGAINYSSGYAAGYSKAIAVDAFTVAAKQGQMLSTGATAALLNRYSAINTPTTTSIQLNHSLKAAVADDAVVGVGPAGDYGWGFHRNAVALVSRPLAMPAVGTGARAFTATYNNISMRVTITYDGLKQGHLVTCDMLLGSKTLDTNLGFCMFG